MATALTFSKEKNIRYWLRCLKTCLPSDYTSNDTSRTSLAYFSVAGLDILGSLGALTSDEERAGWIEWVYLCQHPRAGFRGSTGLDLRKQEETKWDPPNLGSTCFALMTLVILGDDLQRVKRKETLQWLAGLQRSDGSFAEIEEQERSEGERLGVRDTRFVYFAAAIRWILRGENGAAMKSLGEVKDINIDLAVKYIHSCETYDHGFSAAPHLEAHAGLTFCAIAALNLLGRLNKATIAKISSTNTDSIALPNPEGTLQWLVSRQTTLTPTRNEDSDSDSDEEETDSDTEPQASSNIQELEKDERSKHIESNQYMPEIKEEVEEKPEPSLHKLVIPENQTGEKHVTFEGDRQAPLPQSNPEELKKPTKIKKTSKIAKPAKPAFPPSTAHNGFNGRCNKKTDTCYSFWVIGALDILRKSNMIDVQSNRNFLLERTAHQIGGFGKHPGSPPDVLHSYLALATLSVYREEGLQRVDSSLCITKQAKERLEGRSWWKGEQDNDNDGTVNESQGRRKSRRGSLRSSVDMSQEALRKRTGFELTTSETGRREIHGTVSPHNSVAEPVEQHSSEVIP